MAKDRLLIVKAKFSKANLNGIKSKVLESEIIRLTYPNGKVFMGMFEKDKPNGQGTLTHPNGQTVQGIWNKGKLEAQLT